MFRKLQMSVPQYTKKLCTRSLRCPQHTDEQRATARSLLLNYMSPMSSLMAEETGNVTPLTLRHTLT